MQQKQKFCSTREEDLKNLGINRTPKPREMQGKSSDSTILGLIAYDLPEWIERSFNYRSG